MSRPLQPVSEPGQLAFEIARRHAEGFAPEAGDWDRRGRFPSKHIKDMQASGLARATMPVELGGGAAASALRGDGPLVPAAPARPT